MNYWCVWRNFFMCDMTHLHATWFIHEWHDSFMCDTTHSSVTCLMYVWYDSFMCDMKNSSATWLIILVTWQPYSKPKTVAQAQKRFDLPLFGYLHLLFLCIFFLWTRNLGAKDLGKPESDMHTTSCASGMSSKEPYVPFKEPCIVSVAWMRNTYHLVCALNPDESNDPYCPSKKLDIASKEAYCPSKEAYMSWQELHMPSEEP